MSLVPLLLVAMLGCPKEKEAAVKKPSPAASRSPSRAASPAAAARAREEECVDRWLAERNLDRYGSAKGTMYAGGTPLFDERTGKRVDRLDYVYGKHPEARNACGPKAGGR